MKYFITPSFSVPHPTRLLTNTLLKDSPNLLKLKLHHTESSYIQHYYLEMIRKTVYVSKPLCHLQTTQENSVCLNNGDNQFTSVEIMGVTFESLTIAHFQVSASHHFCAWKETVATSSCCWNWVCSKMILHHLEGFKSISCLSTDLMLYLNWIPMFLQVY